MDDKGIFQGQAEAKLEELDSQIKSLESDPAIADMKIKYKKQFEEIYQKREQVKNRLREFDLAGGESWRMFAPGVSDASVALQNSVTEGVEMLSANRDNKMEKEN